MDGWRHFVEESGKGRKEKPWARSKQQQKKRVMGQVAVVPRSLEQVSDR